MIYFFYFLYAFAQGAWATRSLLEKEKYMTENDTIVMIVILFAALAPIVTAVIAYDAMKSVIVFIVTGK